MLHSPLPTTDLYFLNSMRDLVAGLFRKGPVVRLGANTFRSGHRYLVVRRDRDKVVDAVLADKSAEIIYLIDDDLAAADDPTLPEAYRGRLQALRDGQFQRLVDRASLIVASSPAVAEGLKQAATPVRLLNPVWAGVPGDGQHLEAALRGGPLDLVHLGTGSHGAGFAFLIPVIERLLANGADIRFHYFGREGRLGTLDADPRIVRHKPLGWRAYQRRLGGFRYHLGLYPVADTPFNRGRSINKILEYTLAGCPAIYSARWARAQGLSDGDTAFFADDTEVDWYGMISTLLKERQQLVDVYRTAAEAFARLNDAETQRRFWMENLVGGQP